MSDENQNDSLVILRRKYEKEIAGKEAELAALRVKLGSIIEFGAEVKPLLIPDRGSDKYRDVRLIDAVLDSVSCLVESGKGTEYGVTASQVREYLLHHGFKPSGMRNFSITVSVSLKRLVSGKRAWREDYLGKAYYRKDPIK